MDQANLRLSPTEMELVINAEWILTKNKIIDKTKNLFAEILQIQEQIINSLELEIDKHLLESKGKLTRGENYKGLPYLVLDHPRYFDKEDVFVIRTMFWWGNFFSTTLHLAGKYKDEFAPRITKQYTLLKEQGFFICIHPLQWEHHFEVGNYSSLQGISEDEFEKIVTEKPFVKLAKNMPLNQWDAAFEQLPIHFSQLLRCLVS